MNNLIERYVYDVTRRLPEKDREDVSHELMSNICDMLPDDAGEAEIRAVLTELGAPAALAEKYRQKPRYLISSAIFDEYISVLKLILPAVGGIVFAAGLVLGCFDAIKAGTGAVIGRYIGAMLARGSEMGLTAVFYALVWTTVGFAIADRARSSKGEEWTVDSLPEKPQPAKHTIPLPGSIAELVLTLVFAALGIALCTGVVSVPFVIRSAGVSVGSAFSPDFLRACIPAIAVITVFGVGECIAKITVRRWTAPVCVAVILSNIASVAALIFLALRPVILSDEVRELIRQQSWINWDLDALRFLGEGGVNVGIAFATLVAIAAFVECGTAVYKTFVSGRR